MGTELAGCQRQGKNCEKRGNRQRTRTTVSIGLGLRDHHDARGGELSSNIIGQIPGLVGGSRSEAEVGDHIASRDSVQHATRALRSLFQSAWHDQADNDPSESSDDDIGNKRKWQEDTPAQIAPRGRCRKRP
jgi:hypothetical protein